MKIKIRVSNDFEGRIYFGPNPDEWSYTKTVVIAFEEFEYGHVRGIEYLEKKYKKVTERLKLKYYDPEN